MATLLEVRGLALSFGGIRALAGVDFLDLPPYRKTRVADCPYGVQKRVELGRALATEPRVLLLDEPVAGLTAEEKEEVAYWIHEVRGRFRITVLLVEHDLRVASRL